MNWVITGGCGFIGTALIKNLVQQNGHRIRIIDNQSVGTERDLAQVCTFKTIPPEKVQPLNSQAEGQIELIKGDIMDETLALKITQGADVIVHLAANTGVAPSVENPRQDCITNIIGTLNYLEGARINQVKRFIFASSGAPVGEQEPPLHEEMAPHPVSPYGASKLAGEGYCSAYYRTFGVQTIALRFGNVYGPGSIHKNSVVAKFIKKAKAGEKLEIYGDGCQTRDFIYIDDLIDAIRLAAVQPNIGGELFQIATNRETTVGELAEQLVNLLPEFNINIPKIIYTQPRLGDVARNFSDTRKAKEKLNWTVKTDLKEGLRKTLASFVD